MIMAHTKTNQRQKKPSKKNISCIYRNSYSVLRYIFKRQNAYQITLDKDKYNDKMFRRPNMCLKEGAPEGARILNRVFVALWAAGICILALTSSFAAFGRSGREIRGIA